MTEEKVEANMGAAAPADPACWLCRYHDHAAPARGCSPIEAKVRTESEASAGTPRPRFTLRSSGQKKKIKCLYA